ncbi:hypothetical protein JYU34_016693 [Plutella xylostella]|uniref:Solute carrier family 46 member 3 n=1 Tax=Plutella xylostella TaxID=51655 RepID=A0ABQ7Q384_PLUXY|nr:hypothetical protein JYU34_016693 [Plutella xylostella]
MDSDSVSAGVKEHNEEVTERDPLRGNSDTDKRDKSRGTMCSALRNITVEPTVLLFIFSSILTMLTSMNLSLEKACRVNLNYTEDICNRLKVRDTVGLETYEVDVQKLAAVATSWKSVLTSIIPSLVAIFVGSWTDRTGKRILFMVLPIIGQMLTCASNIVNAIFFYQLRLEVLVISEAIFEGIYGSWCLLLLVAYSYITAITTENNRTFRMGITTFCVSIGFPLGMGLSGPLMKKFGYIATYGVAFGIQFINVVYTAIVLKDTKKTSEQKKHEGKGFKHLAGLFFDMSNVKDTFKVIYKDSARICLLLAVVSICYGTMYGETAVSYLLTRYRYNWDEVMYGYFQAYNFVTHTIGVLFSITVFSRRMQLPDAALGIISATSKVASSFVYGFAFTSTIFFIGPVVEILNGTILIAARSMLSKLVEPDDFGKVNSIFSLTENAMQLVYIPLYTRVYTATMQWFPGFMFLMTGGLMVPILIVFIWLLYEHRKQARRQQDPREMLNIDTNIVKQVVPE